MSLVPVDTRWWQAGPCSEMGWQGDDFSEGGQRKLAHTGKCLVRGTDAHTGKCLLRGTGVCRCVECCRIHVLKNIYSGILESHIVDECIILLE